MKLNKGLGFRVGFTFWPWTAPFGGVAGDPGGGGGAMLVPWAALGIAGGRGARGGAGGSGGPPGGRGGPPGRPSPPRADVGLKGRPLLFCCCWGMVAGTEITGPLRLSRGSSVTPSRRLRSSKNPGACSVSDSMKKLGVGLAPPPLGSKALRTKEHCVLQMLSLLTASYPNSLISCGQLLIFRDWQWA